MVAGGSRGAHVARLGSAGARSERKHGDAQTQPAAPQAPPRSADPRDEIRLDPLCATQLSLRKGLRSCGGGEKQRTPRCLWEQDSPRARSTVRDGERPTASLRPTSGRWIRASARVRRVSAARLWRATTRLLRLQRPGSWCACLGSHGGDCRTEGRECGAESRERVPQGGERVAQSRWRAAI